MTAQPPVGGYALGVDIGTTFTAAAIARAGHVEPLTLGAAATVIPTVVAMRPDGEVLVGEAADRRGAVEPERVAREFKRRLGDTTPVVIGGTPYGVEALMAQVLRWVVAVATDREGQPPDSIVLTHPASYGPYKRDLLAQAATLAEVGDVTFMIEPEAAAIDYAERNRLDPGDVVAVYDFGGGTFDAAVLRKTIRGFELLGQAEGIERLGGIDFDHAVFSHVGRALGGLNDEVPPDEMRSRGALVRLRADSRAAKETLSADTEATVPVILPNVQTDVRITRAEFEAMIRPRVAETIAALERAVRSASLAMSDVTRVLLVGGSSRIPLVAEMVRAATGRPVAVDADPKLTIALGGARAGWHLAIARLPRATVAEESTDATPALPPVEGRSREEALLVRRRLAVPPMAVVAALALLVAGSAFALGGGLASFGILTGDPTSGPSVGMLPTPAPTPAATTQSPSSVPPTVVIPPEVDAAFCRFGGELTGRWAAVNDALGAAIAAGDVLATAAIGASFEASVIQMRSDLAVAATWSPLATFATDMSAALQAYQDRIAEWVADPSPGTYSALTDAGSHLMAIGNGIPGLLDVYPGLGC